MKKGTNELKTLNLAYEVVCEKTAGIILVLICCFMDGCAKAALCTIIHKSTVKI